MSVGRKMTPFPETVSDPAFAFWHPKFENNLRLEQNDREILFVFIRHAVLCGEVRRVNCRKLKSTKTNMPQFKNSDL